MLLNHLPCRALISQKKILGMDGVGQILLSFDLNANLPKQLLNAYEKERNVQGKNCLSNMTAQFTLTTESFGQKVERIINENKMTALYLSDSRFVGRAKRIEFGTLSLLLSVFSFFISTTGLVVNGMRLNSVENRLTIMSQHIDELRKNQATLVTNIEYLYEADEFIGIEKDILVDYVNGVKSTYSCDFLKVYFDAIFANFNSFLEKLLNAASSRNLVHELIDRDILDDVTSHKYFKDSIFLVNPSLLYTLASLDLISFKDGVVTFMLSFPYIRRRYEFKTIVLMESPRKLLLQKNDFSRFHSFMLPVDVPLHDIGQSTIHLRSMDNCIHTRSFTACDGNSLLQYEERMCILSMLAGVDTHCHMRNVPVFDFNVEYSDGLALLYLKSNVSILDSQRQLLHKTNESSEKCLLFAKKDGVVAKSNFRTEKLFPHKELVTFQVEDQEMEYTYLLEPKVIDNFTRPVFNHTKSYIPMIFEKVVDSDTVQIVAIVLSSIVFVIILIIFIVRFGKCRRTPVVDGNQLFP